MEFDTPAVLAVIVLALVVALWLWRWRSVSGVRRALVAAESHYQVGQLEQALPLFIQAGAHGRASQVAEELGYPNKAAEQAELAGDRLRAAQLYVRGTRYHQAATLFVELRRFREAALAAERNVGAPIATLVRLWEDAFLDAVPGDGEPITAAELTVLKQAAAKCAQAHLKNGNRAWAAHYFELASNPKRADELRHGLTGDVLEQLDVTRDRLLERLSKSVDMSLGRAGSSALARAVSTYHLLDEGVTYSREFDPPVTQPTADEPVHARPDESPIAAPRQPHRPTQKASPVAALVEAPPAAERDRTTSQWAVIADPTEETELAAPNAELDAADPAPSATEPAHTPDGTSTTLMGAVPARRLPSSHHADAEPPSGIHRRPVERPDPFPIDEFVRVSDPVTSRATDVRRRTERYRLLDPLGAGRMSVVFRAHDNVLGRTVAIKFLSAQIAADSIKLRVFEDDASKVARLRHPNIVQVHDCGVMDGRPFLAMELIDGQTLQQLVTAAPDMRLEVMDVLDIAEGLLAALEHAHARDAVHYDINPANIVRSVDGRVVLLDFGFSDLVDPAVTSRPSGGNAYVAPERLRGERGDQRADVFASGVLLYYLLTGHLPYVSWSFDREPRSTRMFQLAIPEVLDRLILACLEPKPEQRPGSAAPLLEAVRRMRHQIQAFLEGKRGMTKSAAHRAVRDPNERARLPEDVKSLLEDYLKR